MLDAAIVGLGRWGQVLARSIIGRSDKIRLVKGIARTPAKVSGFAAETGLAIDTDYAALLTDPTIGAVLLATPHSQHVEQIAAAAAAGKHVFVEKPLALSARSAAAAFDACEAAGVVLAVGQNRRFLPAYLALKRLIGDGTLGRVLHIEANFSGPSGYRHTKEGWRADPAESPAGGMTGKGLHMTDLMIDILGPVETITAQSSRQVLEIEFDDTTTMLLTFADGATAYLGTITATPDMWRFQVFGSKGWAEIRDEHRLTVTLLDKTARDEDFPAVDVERAELERFADAVAGGTDFPVPREDVIANISLLEAITASSSAGACVRVGKP